MSDKVREQFEAHAISRGDGDCLAAERGVYLDPGISLSWHYWQASRAAALEEARKACAKVRGSYSGPCAQSASVVWALRMAKESAEKCEAAIQALAGRGA